MSHVRDHKTTRQTLGRVVLEIRESNWFSEVLIHEENTMVLALLLKGKIIFDFEVSKAVFTLGARALVLGYRHKMVLCSDTWYQICKYVHSQWKEDILTGGLSAWEPT